MKAFYKYLHNRGYADSTIKQHEKNVQHFLHWLGDNGVLLTQVNYFDIIRFVDYSDASNNQCNLNRNNINRLLSSISYYFDSLSERQPALKNPAKTIRVKGTSRRLAHDIIEYKELLKIFRLYNHRTPREIRNRVILGLLIFQGLTYYELNNLTIEDIRFDIGIVNINGDRSRSLKKGTTSRELPLEAVQMVDLIEYLNNIRTKILSGKYLNDPGRKPERKLRIKNTNQVLLSLKGSPYLKNSLLHLFKDVRKQNPNVKSARQIRQSVISYWLTKHNLRTVQFMAGHRYVSSTEWYKRIDIQELRREVSLYHPLKREYSNLNW